MPRAGGSKVIALHFPTLGLDRRFGFQSQPPYSTPSCLNVRPDSTQPQRERGGSRPGIGPAFRETLGSGNPVRMLSVLDVIDFNGFTFWQDTFEGSSLGSAWATAAHLTAAPAVLDRRLYVTTEQIQRGIVRSALSDFDTADDYYVEMWIEPYRGEHFGHYRLLLRMDDASPNASTGGLVATLTMTGTTGAFSGSLSVNGGASTYNFTPGTDGYAAAGWFTVKVSGNNITAWWRDSTLISGQAVAAATGKRVGLSMAPSVTRHGELRVGAFRVQYNQTANTRDVRRIAMASANGLLYKETFMGTMAQVSSSLTLAADRTLAAQQRLRKLYIADVGTWKSNGTDGVRGTTNAKFDSATVSDWTTVGISTADDVLVVYDSTAPLVLLDGVYDISSVASGELTLATNLTTGATAATCKWFITRAPKVYDYETNALTKWTATTGLGFVPPTQPIICLYRDRLVLAGGSDSPHLWYMSRQGDPLDWDYGAEDVGRAIAGQNSQAGRIGEPITALVPHADNCLVLGCRNSTWILRGDPAYGGQIDNLSRSIGFVDKHAWCYVPSVSSDSSVIAFLSLDGLYLLPAGCGTSEPVSMSRERLPEELLYVDAKLVEVQLAYDLLHRGIHIYLTKKDSGQTTHWWFDWESKGFFQVSLPTNYEPLIVCEYAGYSAEDSAVLLGGRTGKICRYHVAHDKDYGNNAITSYVDYGPIVLGDQTNYVDGIVAETQVMLGQDSADALLEIRTGKTAEQANSATASWAAAMRKDLNHTRHPRRRGNAAMLRLSNAESLPWSVESISLRIEQGGRNR